MSGGILSRGDFGWVDFVRVDFVRVDFVRGDFVRGDFVLEPQLASDLADSGSELAYFNVFVGRSMIFNCRPTVSVKHV